jgi:hypothetical protein
MVGADMLKPAECLSVVDLVVSVAVAIFALGGEELIQVALKSVLKSIKNTNIKAVSQACRSVEQAYNSWSNG